MKDIIEIEFDEGDRGYELSMTDSDGERRVFNVQVAAFSLIAVGDTVRRYFAEGEQAARAHEADRARLDYEESRDEALIGLGEVDGWSAP